MSKKYPMLLSLVGVSVMVFGVTDRASGEIGMMAFVLGFVLVTAGLVLGVKDMRSDTKSKTKEEKDKPALIRATGVGIGLISLTVPYFGSPTTPGATETARSVVDIAVSAVSGVSAQVNFMLLVLIAVVLAGSFVAVFHHAGGYVMLLGGMTAVFMSMGTTGTVEMLADELSYGLYLMLLAAIIIISSAFASTTDVYDSDTDWSSGLMVWR